jgi:hypothetical protein
MRWEWTRTPPGLLGMDRNRRNRPGIHQEWWRSVKLWDFLCFGIVIENRIGSIIEADIKVPVGFGLHFRWFFFTL